MHPRAAALSLLVLCCAAQAASADMQEPFSHPQQMVDIGGRRLNLYCSGSGAITVVFDAPSGDAGWTWFAVQPEVARRTRACVYDRAGMGFSDPSPLPSTSSNAVDDLHKLLHKAGIAPPYVMVGNSFGGGNAQLYAYRYPDEVKGLVLVEAQHEDETERLNAASQGKLKQMYAMQAEMRKACVAESEKGFAPGSDMAAMCTGGIQQRHGRKLAAANLAAATSPAYWRAAASEMGNIDVSNAELRAARRSFGAMPVLSLSRGVSPYAVPGKPQSALNKAMEQANLAVHQELAALSSRGAHRIVPGAGHIIQHDKPAAVVQAVDAMLNMVR